MPLVSYHGHRDTNISLRVALSKTDQGSMELGTEVVAVEPFFAAMVPVSPSRAVEPDVVAWGADAAATPESRFPASAAGEDTWAADTPTAGRWSNNGAPGGSEACLCSLGPAVGGRGGSLCLGRGGAQRG